MQRVVGQSYFAIGLNMGSKAISQILNVSELPMQGVWVWSLVEELRSHMLHSVAKTFFFFFF